MLSGTKPTLMPPWHGLLPWTALAFQQARPLQMYEVACSCIALGIYAPLILPAQKHLDEACACLTKPVQLTQTCLEDSNDGNQVLIKH